MRSAGTPEVLIVGGGPSGLLLADLLGTEYTVVIIDKLRIGATEKYWITNTERLKRHDLKDFIRYRTCCATFGTFLGRTFRLEGDFVVAAEQRLLRELAQRAKAAGVLVMEETSLLSVRWSKRGITAETSRGPVQPKILIDATGGGSPLGSTFRLHRLDGFFPIAATHLENIELHGSAIAAGHVLRLGDPPLILEVAPTGQNSAFCSVFQVTRAIPPREKLISSLNEHVAANPSFSFHQGSRMRPPYVGAIPIGSWRQRHTPHLTSFGEAGMIQSPLLGGAFNEALVYAHQFAQRIREALASSSVSVVKPVQSLSKSRNDLIQRLLALFLLDASTQNLELLVRMMHRLGSAKTYSLLRDCQEINA